MVGWPIEHSRSPLIHNYWISHHGLDAEYGRHALDPAQAMHWFDHFADHGLVGANVTVPHKETAFAACRYLTERARRLGSVNTLWLEDAELCGDSTDGEGFMQHLKASAPNWRKHSKSSLAIVLGAGGASRAIVDALMHEGVERVAILNRTIERAKRLAQDLGVFVTGQSLIAMEISRFDEVAPESGLLINTSSMGMAGGPPLNIDLASLAKGATVADIVYSPLDTDLLKAARGRGHPTVDGLGMLLFQAVPGFHKWFGVRPTVTKALRDLVVADLEN
ncbi:MAG: shikimate dehydrogenase [Pseudomonadota bacterium]